jgi:NAD(P)-dependent dehydrogenase (short-subunit alcohol dehydrogenase family)
VELAGKVVVVTGAGSGIGRALAVRFAAEGAAGVVVADLEGDRVERTVALIAEAGGTALPYRCDVSVEAEVQALVAAAVEAYGPVDLFCSNAGIAIGGGVEAPDADWQRIWEVNLMAHVYAARAVLPAMIDRGDGYLLSTASAAGLLTNLGAAPYAVTKHAAVALAEWLAVTHGDQGIKVSCLCPQGVATRMLLGDDAEDVVDGAPFAGGDEAGQSSVLAAGDVLTPAQVADVVVAGLADERFLILPHPEVATTGGRRRRTPTAGSVACGASRPGCAPVARSRRRPELGTASDRRRRPTPPPLDPIGTWTPTSSASPWPASPSSAPPSSPGSSTVDRCRSPPCTSGSASSCSPSRSGSTPPTRCATAS